MCDVTQANFKLMLPEIQENISSCNFIAIDCEFTALDYSTKTLGNLFDSPANRYKKLRETVNNSMTCQIGISTFKKVACANKFEVHSYNFYISPFPTSVIDKRFIFQSSCLNFLCTYNFDFNKFAYEGISSLNLNEAESIQNHFKIDNFVDICSSHLRNLITEQIDVVCKWVDTAQNGEKMILDISKQHSLSRVQHEIMKVALSQIYLDVDVQTVNLFDFQLVKLTEKKKLEDVDYSDAMQLIIGFTNVFKALVNAKKTIVGHNFFTDLMFIYHQFYEPLPNSYNEFKNKLHKLFPSIYDTKCIVLNNRKKLKDIPLSNLSSLMQTLKSSSYSGLFAPHFHHVTKLNNYDDNLKIHEAGYDAYITGHVFINLAHYLASSELSSNEKRTLTFAELMGAVKDDMNKINMIRASVHHVNLAGHDPVCARPTPLFVEIKNCSRRKSVSNGGRVRPEMIADLFAPYGSVDVMINGPNEAIVAVGNVYCANDILKAFHGNQYIKVTTYSFFRHSKWVRAALWSASILSSSAGLYLIFLIYAQKRC